MIPLLTIINIIQKSFINDDENLCENIDVGWATKAHLDNTHVSLEKKKLRRIAKLLF